MFDSLEFHDDLATHEEIRKIAGLYLVVADRRTDLLAERDVGVGKLVMETPLIHGFERPRSQASMNAHGEAGDPIREVFAMRGLGVHVDSPAVMVAGLAEITDERLMDRERKTLTQIWGSRAQIARKIRVNGVKAME